MRLTILLVLAMLSSGCVMSGPDATEQVCAGWKPIMIGDDLLTDETARAILAHNLFGQEIGCW